MKNEELVGGLNYLAISTRIKKKMKGKKTFSIIVILLLIVTFFISPRLILINISNQCSKDPPSNLTVRINGQNVISYRVNDKHAIGWVSFKVVVWGTISYTEVIDKEVGISDSKLFFTPLGGSITICPHAMYNQLEYSLLPPALG